VKKDGRRRGVQRYRCLACGSYFSSKRRTNLNWVAKAYKDYTVHKQTYAELSQKYGKSGKTLRKLFDEHAAVTGEMRAREEPFVLILDATFFGRGYGILLARCPSKVIYWSEIETETVQVYMDCLDALNAAEYTFSTFVIDGRRGVRQLLEKRFPGTPIQFCQFHQIWIVKRYIPKKAKTEAAKSLRKIALTLAQTSEVEFTQSLNEWHAKYEDFLKEKSFIEGGTKRWRYTHGRLRSAYRSLRTNLPYLFTFQHRPNLQIPNTTNHCDGLFAHIKQKVLIHRGISKQRRKEMIDYLLENF